MDKDYHTLYYFLQLIAEGYDYEVLSVSNQFDEVSFYVSVENPNYQEDDGSSKKHVFIVSDVFQGYSQ